MLAPRAARHDHLWMDASHASGPGLAKTRGERLVRVRVVTALRTSDARFRAMFETADVLSEGSVVSASSVSTWFGTTSLILAWPPGMVSPDNRAQAVGLWRRRKPIAGSLAETYLRAVRVAHREAALRAPGSLGCLECEVRVEAGDDGLRIDVDVQAPLTLPSHAGMPRGR